MAYASEFRSWEDERKAVEKRRLRQVARRTASHRDGWADVRFTLRALAVGGVIAWGSYMAASCLSGAAYSLHHPHPAVVAEAGR